MSTLNAGETLQPFKPLRNNLIFDSSGNLVGIQNDRANGNDFRIGGGSGVDGTFATLVATTALKINSGATLDLYNTADQTTNYERLRADYSSNVARLITQFGGTGNIRGVRVGIGVVAGSSAISRYMEIDSSGVFRVDAAQSAGGSNSAVFTGSLAASSGTQTGISVAFPVNQSGTAGYTALDINPTETATGSGTNLLQRWAVGGTQQAYMTTTGGLVANILVSTSGLSMGASLGAVDLTLTRDAADTLALRRGPNAQTFRAYNTYTDASNYERGVVGWGSNVFQIGTFKAGTGASRNLAFYIGNSATWLMSAPGHFIANSDNTLDIGASGANRPRNLFLGGGITHGSTTLLTTTTALTNGAAADTGTLTNAPAAGDPTKWIPINDNGTTRYIPAW